MSQISMQSYIKGKKGIDITDLDGDLVMMDLDQGIYFSMNEQAGDIWKLIQKRMQVKAVANELKQLYEVSEEECDKHVLGFIRMLDDAKLITIY